MAAVKSVETLCKRGKSIVKTGGTVSTLLGQGVQLTKISSKLLLLTVFQLLILNLFGSPNCESFLS